MALPLGIKTCEIIFGPFTRFDGSAVTGSVSFTPSRSLIWVATGTPVLASTFVVQLDQTGSGRILLPYTNQPGFSDGVGHTVTDWTYRVTFQLSGADAPQPFSFQVPVGVDSFDLDLTTPVGSSQGIVVNYPGVLSVNGQTGNVTVTGTGGGGGTADSVAWLNITGKPTTFAPSAHNHPIADVIGLQSALSAKADSASLGSKADVSALAAKADASALATTPMRIRMVNNVYPPRPATPRPIDWLGPNPPPPDGTTAGGGGMDPTLDLWYEMPSL